MKTKEEIYVVIDTPKKAKKIKKLLDMFGENIYESTNERIISGTISIKYPLINFNEYWVGVRESIKNIKTEVSIKELRNILAVEHLKEGDVVVVKNNSGKWIVKLTGNNIDRFEHSASYNLDLGIRNNERVTERHNKIYGASFIRYATEEERALLEDKPKELTKEEVEKKVVEYAVSVDWNYDRIKNYIIDEIEFEEWVKLDGAYSNGKAKVIIEKFKPKLEVGKWYKHRNGELPNWIVFYGENFTYGFSTSGVWFETNGSDYQDMLEYMVEQNLVEATKEEVEKALIKEAKKRYKVGDKVRSLVTVVKYELLISSLKFNNMGVFGDLWVNSTNETQKSLIFRNGKWAKIVEPSFVDSSDKIKVAGENIGKRVRIIDGGYGAKGCDGKVGIIVDRSSVDFSKYGGACSTDRAECYIMTDEGYYWGLCDGYELEYIEESSPLTVSLEIKDIATLQVIQKTLKELEEKLTKLI